MSTSQVPLYSSPQTKRRPSLTPHRSRPILHQPKTIGPGLPLAKICVLSRVHGPVVTGQTDRYLFAKRYQSVCKRSRSIYKVIGTSFYALWNSISFSTFLNSLPGLKRGRAPVMWLARESLQSRPRPPWCVARSCRSLPAPQYSLGQLPRG